jgi:hypothetical protein
MLFVRVFAAAMRQLWRAHRGLTALTIGSGLLLAVSLLAGLVDARQVLGAPVWMKPAKFAASVAVAAPLMAWIIGQMVGGPTLGRGPRFRRLRQAGNVMALMGTLELVIITVQAVRGVPSHFNASSPVNGALFTIMGIGITVFWLAQSYVAARSFRHPFATGGRTWAVRLGLAVSLLGGGLGFLMPRPTPAQLESLRAGRPTPVVGAHAVGVPEGGDLRVPHFFGLHALQGLPLLALLLERRRRPSARPIVAAGIAWGGLTLTTLVQALRGQPLLSPDAITLAMLLAFGLVSLAVARGYLTLNASDGGRSSWLRGSPVQ